MKVLLVGGSGMVGTFITPYLAKQHTLRVLDVRPPAASGAEYVEGSISDPEAVRRGLDGCDTFINLVMNGAQGGASTEQSIPLILSNYEVNTLGLHLLLYTAQELGIRRGVHTSTMSVHYRDRTWYPQEESVPLDTPSVYGLTKSLAEIICAYFARWFDMNIIALRITGPALVSVFSKTGATGNPASSKVAAATTPGPFSPRTRRIWPPPTWLRWTQSRSATAASTQYSLPATRTKPTTT